MSEASSSPPSNQRVSIWLLGSAIGPMVLFILSRRPIVDNSFLWHVVAGRVQLESGAVITTDPFSFTRLGEAWRTQSWLIELAYGSADRVFGTGFAGYVAPVLGSIVFVTLAVTARTRVRTGVSTALVMAASTILLVPFLQPRPVIASYLGLALVGLVSERRQLHWTLPLIVWLWAGVHGSFPLAFVLMGTVWFTTRQRSLIYAGLASLLTLPLTAHGTGIVSILLSFSESGPALDRISEWNAPDLLSPMFLPFTIAIPIVVRYFAKTGVDARRGLPVLAWFIFGLSAVRSMPLAWIALFPLVVDAVEDLIGRRVRTSTAPRALVVVAAGVLVVFPLLLPRDAGFNNERFPVEAAEALTAERVFHDDVTGGYLIYSAWPDQLVYIDDRAELFQDELVRFADVRTGQAPWEDLFTEWGIEQALVRREDAIAAILAASPDWEPSYEDDVFVVFDPS